MRRYGDAPVSIGGKTEGKHVSETLLGLRIESTFAMEKALHRRASQIINADKGFDELARPLFAHFCPETSRLAESMNVIAIFHQLRIEISNAMG